MHLMRCPDGLVWDNKDKICMDYSTTCNIGGSPVPAIEGQQESVDYYATGEEEPQQPAYYAAEGAEKSEKAAAVPDYYAVDANQPGYYEPNADYYVAVDDHQYYQPPQGNADSNAEPAYYEPIDAQYQPK
jgi:hypothetical protein